MPNLPGKRTWFGFRLAGWMWWYYNSADIIVVPLILILIWVILKTQNRRYDYCSVNNLNIYIHALLQQFSWYISKQQIHSSSYVLVVHRGILQYFMHDYSICSLHLHKHQLQIAFKLWKALLRSNQVVKRASCVIDLLLMRSQIVLYYEVREESGLISALICLVWD